MPAKWIKVCGITSNHDARMAQAAGADAIGLVLVPGDIRAISLDEAAAIAASITIETVVVMRSPTPEFLREVALMVAPDRIQLDLPATELLETSPLPCYRSLQATDRGILSRIGEVRQDRFLVRFSDNLLPGGAGYARDPSLLRELASMGRMVAGGDMDPDNVRRVLEASGAWGVDVVAGVERELGVKNWELTSSFVKQARGLA